MTSTNGLEVGASHGQLGRDVTHRATVAVGGVALSLALAACSSATPLEHAFSTCEEAGRIADDGHTLIVDTKGEDDTSGDSFAELACLLLALEAPSSVTTHMDSTRALDGMQTNSWDVYEARWTYHPDVGMNLTITLTD